MIKAEELRIGNRVWGISDRVEIISELQRDKLETVFRGYMYNYCVYEDIAPIELCEEWLVKAGFEKIGDDCYFSYRLSINTVDELAWYNVDKFIRYQTKRSGFTRPFQAKYLHQLQNLYYALTNTELTITL